MLTFEWDQAAALAVRYEEGKEEGWEKCERNMIELLESGKSPEEIIREFRTRTVQSTSHANPQT